MKDIFYLIFSLLSILLSVIAASEVKLSETESSSNEDIISFNSIDYPEFVDFMNLITTADFLNLKEEVNELKSFHGILSYVEMICEEGLRRKDETFAINWISALYTLAKEIREDSHESIKTSETIELSDIQEASNVHEIGKVDSVTFEPEASTLTPIDFYDCEDYHLYNTAMNLRHNDFEHFSAIKCKMMKKPSTYEEHEYYDTYSNTEEFSEDEILKGIDLDLDEKRNDSDEEKDETTYIVRHKFDPKRRNRNRGISRIVNTNTLNAVATTFLTTEEDDTSIGGVSVTDNADMLESMITSTATAGLSSVLGPNAASLATIGLNAAMDAGNSNGNAGLVASLNPLENPALMEQLQQQIMTQVMGQLAASNPQIVSVLQQERDRLTEVLGTNSDDLPQISREGIIQFLRTSALPKLINSAIKGKTGIDVLKSLALVLKVLNEGLGVFEVVLKILIKVTRKVRYYSLYGSAVLADMAREDEMKPMIDLSVPVDHLPEVQAKKSTMRRVTKMFRKSLKRSSNKKSTTNDPNEGEDEEGPSSPFTLGIQGALTKARAHTAKFREVPPKLLLTLIHTILVELEKRDGLLRDALAGKQHKNLLKLQNAVSEGIETIYKAILSYDPEAQEHLSKIPISIFTEILICLIAPVEMQTLTLNSHITNVTQWIKPLMAILDEESQLKMLDFLLNDPEAEQHLFKKAKNGKSIKTFNYSGF